MEDNVFWFRTMTMIGVCVTIIMVSALIYCYNTNVIMAENGYTRATLPGANDVYWVKENK